MTDRPIIFSGPMVQALLSGRETMTRRLALTSRRLHEESTPTTYRSKFKIIPSPWQKIVIGDRLWVRENWCPANSDNGPVLLTQADTGRRYLADESWPVDYDAFPAGNGAWSAWAGDVESGTTKAWRPSIHMPRWASRLTLIITGTKIEPLNNISANDAEREGIPTHCVEHTFRKVYRDEAERAAKRIEYFADLWKKLHGDDAWDANPRVVALSFDVVKANIDQVPA